DWNEIKLVQGGALMNSQEAKELFEYDTWATDRVLDAAQKAGYAFLSERSQGVGSIRDLIIHVADGELMWLHRILGQPLPTDVLFKYDRFSTVDQVREHCHKVNQQFRDYVANINQAELDRQVKYVVNPFGPGPEVETPVWQILMQVHSHGIHHRSEAAELLSRTGNAPEETNYQHWFVGRYMASRR
ncbi:MAG TPA: DinB family protein, partial [Dehalococcoidia bacterium]|nr:DinB family protein [Dehalococcoidia bacterium]